MTIDPTTLHGRPWKSLTVEEREACPDGTELRHPTRNFGPLRRESGLWVDLAGNTHDTAMMTLADPMGYVVHIPGAVPTPDQFREMHQLLGGKTDPARIPRPNERPPVYAIGRFVVMPAVGGVFAVDASQITGVGPVGDGTLAYVLQGEQCPLPPGVTVLDLLHAIAKAEGR